MEKLCADDEISDGILNEILHVNLSYLMLAQRLARVNASVAMFRLGLSKDLVDLLASLTLSQMLGLAASSQLLCRFRFDDHATLASLSAHHGDQAIRQAHTAILLAAQPAGQVN